ncbi:MAG: uroporphyrinogen decarboxylase [Leptospiraceae bacterium]|nr:uroporphyrinogen decarboxylase [Leptospiraceae bacterium]MDW7975571.1 uroporphyrinogen decarboxylase [Leptospiraceae bacterium]
MRILKALQKQPLDRVPYWFMRQAGRYLPEYHQVKGSENFLSLTKNIEKSIEISLQPHKRFDVDGVIIFADILTPLEALGISIEFRETIGPVVQFDIFHPEQRQKLKQFDPENQVAFIKKVIQGIKNYRDSRSPETGIIGFAGAPFTLLSYLIERKTSKQFENTKEFMFNFEDLYHEVMMDLTSITISYLNHQIDSGVDVVQLFDSWGGYLTFDQYHEFVFPYMKKIIDEIKRKIPVILFVGNHAHLTSLLVELKPSCLSLDWRIERFDDIPDDIAIQGNMDPLILLGKQGRVTHETTKILERFARRKNFIFNLGHGMNPHTPLHNVEAMIETIRNFRL